MLKIALAIILTSCVKVNSSKNIEYIAPVFPEPTAIVGDELYNVCTDRSCSNINKWLNDLRLFKKEYEKLLKYLKE